MLGLSQAQTGYYYTYIHLKGLVAQGIDVGVFLLTLCMPQVENDTVQIHYTHTRLYTHIHTYTAHTDTCPHLSWP